MAHSHKSHYFHLIWPTKNRTKWISPDMQSRLYPYMGGIIRNHNGSLLEIGGIEDNVHLLICLKNLDNYSYLLRDIKAHSTLWIHKNFPDLKEFEWQEGFSSFSLHFSLIDTVKNYIRNQEKHHKTVTFEEEYLKFLDGQNIQYDKRFVFG
ncbi:MAG: transposase [Parachlamydiaceae bacterium]|nr:transposase [Parachlamydiaceae bacterium]